jgi:capsular exopolysaccharide synthesis family protein
MRRKGIVALVALLVSIYAVFNYLTAERYYTAHARLLFKPEEGKIMVDKAPWRYFLDREKVFNTHLELLKSNNVLTRVVQTFEDDISPSTISADLKVKQGETNEQKNDIIELSYRDTDKYHARDVVNQLCKVYIEYRREVNAQEITRLIRKLETQIEKVQAELTQRENELRNFKEQNRMVQLSTETNIIVTKLSNMELALQQTQLDLLESKQRWTALQEQIGQQDINIIQSMTYENPYQNRLADLELELSTLLAEYSEEHFRVQSIQDQIKRIKEAMELEIHKKATQQTLVKNPIRESLLQELVNLTVEKSALEAKRTAQEQIIEQLNSELLTLPMLEQTYANLQRETESHIQTLDMLRREYESAKIRRDSQESDLKILELAKTPLTAVSETPLNRIFIGVIFGIILGIAIAFLLDYLDQTIKKPADIEKGLELPLLGMVPFIETGGGIFENADTHSKTALEPFRALRANIKHIAARKNCQTIMVCSGVKGEGKTTLAANLAITFALDDKRVVLIDSDMRRSQIHSLFSFDKENGLSEYLNASRELNEILKTTSYKNLSIITSGEHPHNPAELLGTRRFEKLIEELRKVADVVLFDSPALLPVSDAINMAPKMDACIVIVRALWTPLKGAQQAVTQLRRINTRLIGAILNGVAHVHGYYPYYYGYYGYYNYKYSYEDDGKRRSGFREFGLHVEENIKSAIHNFSPNLHHSIAVSGSFVRYLTRKKLFWILSLLAIGLTVVQIVSMRKETESKSPSIEYLGFDERYATEGISSQQSVPTLEALSAGARLEENDSTGDETGAVSERSFGSVEESIRSWFRAFIANDSLRYFGFYDSASFQFPGGGFEGWKERYSLRKQWYDSLQSEPELRNIMTIPIKDNYYRTEFFVSSIHGDTTVTKTYTMIWNRTPSGWRIIREKRR